MKKQFLYLTVQLSIAGVLLIGVVFVGCQGEQGPTAPAAPPGSAAPSKSFSSDPGEASVTDLGLPEESGTSIDQVSEKAVDPKVGSVGCTTDADCDDGNVCNGNERCDGSGICQAGTPLNCETPDACLVARCDATLGCVEEPLFCDDANSCTADSCVAGACVNDPIEPCCGNLECEIGEDCNTCATDCIGGTEPFFCCGDGTCEGNEEIASCELDCGLCVPPDCVSDSDGDGVTDEVDICPGTLIPEAVPTRELGRNRWALVDHDGQFDTNAPNGKGPGLGFTIGDTAGCSCEQIIAALGLGSGHEEFGCSTGAMKDWVTLVNP